MVSFSRMRIFYVLTKKWRVVTLACPGEKMHLHAYPAAPAPPIKKTCKPPIKNYINRTRGVNKEKKTKGEGNVGAGNGTGGAPGGIAMVGWLARVWNSYSISRVEISPVLYIYNFTLTLISSLKL